MYILYTDNIRIEKVITLAIKHLIVDIMYNFHYNMRIYVKKLK